MWENVAKPKKIIDLCSAKIEETRIISPVGSANTISASTSSGRVSVAQFNQFLVILSEANEFCADTENTKFHWVNFFYAPHHFSVLCHSQGT